MPTYTYKCSGCGVNFELFQKFADDPLETCPSCGGSVRRVIHPVGVVFKGSGWYINDSKSTTKSASSPAPAAEKSADDAAKPAEAPAPAVPAAPAAAE